MRIIASALIAAAVAGCTRSRALQRSELSAQPLPQVWVTRSDHSKVVMRSPLVIGDTLIGTVNGVPEQLLLFETPEVSTRDFSTGRTALLVTSTLALGTLAYFASTWHPKPGPAGANVCTCDTRIDSICSNC